MIAKFPIISRSSNILCPRKVYYGLADSLLFVIRVVVLYTADAGKPNHIYNNTKHTYNRVLLHVCATTIRVTTFAPGVPKLLRQRSVSRETEKRETAARDRRQAA